MTSLRFLGTGGLGGARIKNKLSKEYRRFSTLLIDEKIIIDPSEDVFEFQDSFMLSGLLDEVRDVFITHSHLDHFSISAIEKMAARHSIRVYATESLGGELKSLENVRFIEIQPFSITTVGTYRILPLPSNHKTDIPSETALNYLIESEGKNLFYALDGAFINPSAWQVLSEIRLDAVILDCALGLDGYSKDSPNHNNLSMVMTVRDIFLSAGSATESTKFVISHIPTSKKRMIHEELCEAVADTPIRVAYDGYYIGL